ARRTRGGGGGCAARDPRAGEPLVPGGAVRRAEGVRELAAEREPGIPPGSAQNAAGPRRSQRAIELRAAIAGLDASPASAAFQMHASPGKRSPPGGGGEA